MHKIDTVRFPNYSARDVARYTRLPSSTVRYWTRGRTGHPPVIRVEGLMSFVNLVEVHMLGVFRRHHGVPLQKLRRVVSSLARLFPKEPHPLATRKFWTDGSSVLTEKLGQIVSLSEPGQLALPDVIECYARRVEWRGSMPRRLFPFTTRTFADVEVDPPRHVVIDPDVAFGRPVVAGTGITTAVLFERFSAGESMPDLAKDYGLDLHQVEDAIRCEQAEAAA